MADYTLEQHPDTPVYVNQALPILVDIAANAQ